MICDVLPQTTLLDVLAGRKNSGLIEGDIRVAGHPKDGVTFARVSGFVEQVGPQLLGFNVLQ